MSSFSSRKATIFEDYGTKMDSLHNKYTESKEAKELGDLIVKYNTSETKGDVYRRRLDLLARGAGIATVVTGLQLMKHSDIPTNSFDCKIPNCNIRH